MRRTALVAGRLTVRQARFVVAATALFALAAKLVVAAKTYGTNDIAHWRDFAAAVDKVGPIHIYGYHFTVYAVYNHPPLIGYFLEVVNFSQHHLGIPLKVFIRGAASIADVVTAFVVFELVRRRRSLLDATASGVVVALSPVLFAISSFHGNTDPIFTMFVLLSLYLLADRRWPLAAGVAIGIALGIKIVAVVAVPSLFVYALRRGPRTLIRFVIGAAVTMLITWGPAVALVWPSLRTQVLEYPGLGLGQWGVMQFGHWAGDPWWVAWLKGSGRTLIVLACAVVPAIAVLRRPRTVVVAVAVSLVAFLALSPAFAVQYLAWAAATTFLVSFWGGAAYNVFAAALLFKVYTRWSEGFPWTKKMAFYHPLTAREVVLGVVVWFTLLCVTWSGLKSMFLPLRQPPTEADASTTPVSESAPPPTDDGRTIDRAERPAPVGVR